jgi:hypothetical protein
MGLNAIPGFVVIIISGFLFIVAIMSLFIPIWIWRIKNEIVITNQLLGKLTGESNKTEDMNPLKCWKCSRAINSKAGVCPHCGAPVIVGR